MRIGVWPLKSGGTERGPFGSERAGTADCGVGGFPDK